MAHIRKINLHVILCNSLKYIFQKVEKKMHHHKGRHYYYTYFSKRKLRYGEVN